MKAFPAVHPAALERIGLGVGGLMLLVLTLAFDEAHVLPDLARTWFAQVYLIVFGSLVVFTLYLFVLRRWTASAVSYEGVRAPLVAILLSVWLQDEPITWAFALGSVLVFVGVYFGVLRRSSARD